jgi:hypothetical protein
LIDIAAHFKVPVWPVRAIGQLPVFFIIRIAIAVVGENTGAKANY